MKTKEIENVNQKSIIIQINIEEEGKKATPNPDQDQDLSMKENIDTQKLQNQNNLRKINTEIKEVVVNQKKVYLRETKNIKIMKKKKKKLLKKSLVLSLLGY